ncbi:MAG TPA: YdeI/OmpD-associated family protein [Microlunatus sp.]
MATPLPPESERFEPGSLADWHDWLAEHHGDISGIWLVTPRKRPPESDLTYDECVREALCWGWIDGQVKALDETRNLQRWTPRSPRSGWSRTNQVRVAELDSTGRIQPSGRAVIEAAKVSGTWSLFDDVEDLIEPAALSEALAAAPAARAAWDGFPPSARKQGLAQIALARQQSTKAKRIALIVDKAARGERP